MTPSPLLRSGKRPPERALVLSGGGIRIGYQAGALRALEEQGLAFDHVDATSGGALNAAMLLSGLDAAEMCRRWRSLDPTEFVALRSPDELLDGDGCVALGSAEGLRDEVFPTLGIDLEKVRRRPGPPATFNVLDYDRKVPEAVEHHELTVDHLVAGMSLPGVLPPVEIDGRRYLDPAFVLDANLLRAVEGGAREIWLVWVLGNTRRYRGGLLRLYVQMLEMSANGNLNAQLGRLRRINERRRAAEGGAGPVRLHLIRPERPLPLDPALFTGGLTASDLVDMGYRDARAYLREMDPDGVSLEPEVLVMSDAKAGITFSETMSGGFALDVTDPERGRELGEERGHELALVVRVEIEDLDRFEDDPDHPGSLTGHVDFPPLGTGIPASRGIFNLFSPGASEDEKLMVYEVALEHEGEPYHLAGRKRVHDDPGFDLWDDTTTLYTRLHRGEDASGETVGAGVLELGVGALKDLVASVRVPGAEDEGQRAAVIGRFGRLFLGELWDTYAPLAGGSDEG